MSPYHKMQANTKILITQDLRKLYDNYITWQANYMYYTRIVRLITLHPSWRDWLDCFLLFLLYLASSVTYYADHDLFDFRRRDTRVSVALGRRDTVRLPRGRLEETSSALLPLLEAGADGSRGAIRWTGRYRQAKAQVERATYGAAEIPSSTSSGASSFSVTNPHANGVH